MSEYRNSPDPEVPAGFIVLHDTESKTKKAAGYKFIIKADSIDVVWGYGNGHSTVAVKGSYFHVEESREEVLALITENTP